MFSLYFRILAFTVFIASAQSHALKKVDSSLKLNDVTLTETLELEELDQIKLKAVGNSLRNKKVAFMDFKVYVAEIFMAKDSTWNKKAAEFTAANPAAIQMTFLRDVPGENMMEAFTDSLKANGANTKSESLKGFLAAVSKVKELKTKDVFIVARNKTDKTDQVLLLIPGKLNEIISGTPGWSDEVLKIWAGKASDAGLEKMQKGLFP